MQAQDQITVVMVTSPIPSNPDTRIIEETIASVRKEIDSKIIIAADGVRPQQVEQRLRNYDEYLRRVCEKANREWDDVEVLKMPHWGHQANTTKYALKFVTTPLVLFMEHDTPLVDDFYDWDALVAAALGDKVNMIRFYHETQIHPEHRHMMLDQSHIHDVAGTPLVRTIQWSQRPHLIKTSFYRTLLDTYFGGESRTMIEDSMHGVLWTSYQELGNEGWERFKVWLYSPDTPSIKRSEHLDGRESDPKFDMYYEYDGHETPWAAPARTAGRTD